MVHKVHSATHGSLNLTKYSTGWARYGFIYPQQPHEMRVPISLWMG